MPELYNYHVDMLPGLSLQARVGYVFGYKWLRVGVDAGYRFAGGSTIVIQLPDRDSVPGRGRGRRRDDGALAHGASGAAGLPRTMLMPD